MMDRRALATFMLGLLVRPLAAGAQAAARVWRIGFLGAEATSTNRHFLDAFRLGMREHGYVEGTTSPSRNDGPKDEATASVT